MNEIPYSFYKVADITQVADSEKVAGTIFFDDATECVHVYGVDGTPVIYGSRKWTWSGINYNTFVNEVSVGDCVLWSATELTIVARKDISADNAVKVTLISDRGFNTLTFRKAATATEWSFVSSVVEDFDDFVKTTDVVSTASTPNTVVGRDGTGDIWTRGIVSEGQLYALPRTALANSGNEDFNLQEQIVDLEEIRKGASAGNNSLPATLDYNEYTFAEKITPEVKNESATISSIKGNTVVWNQLVGAGTTSVTLVAGRIYISNIDGIVTRQAPTSDTTIVVDATADKIHDLTQMFGVGNEPITVEEFYAMVGTKELSTEYNEGELVGFNGRTLKSLGANLVNPKEISVGRLNSDGSVDASASYVNILVDVAPNHKYYLLNVAPLTFSRTCAFYTVDGHFLSIGSLVNSSDESGYITTPNNAFYMRVVARVQYKDTFAVYKCDDSGKTVYEGQFIKYMENSLSINNDESIFPNGMLRINNDYKDSYDEIYVKDYRKNATRKLQIIELDKLSWELSSAYNDLWIAPRNTYGILAKSNALLSTERYSFMGGGEYINLDDGQFTISSNSWGLHFKDSSCTTVDDFKAKISGIKMLCELETPVEIDLGPIDLFYSAQLGGTEKFISDGITAPATVEISYNYDARSNIESLKQSVAKGNGSLVQTVSLLTASGNITKDVYDAMIAADIVKYIYNDGQYELTMSSKEKSNGMIMYSTVFFSAVDTAFKFFGVIFSAPSDSSNAVSYQVTLANLSIGTLAITE